MEETTPINKLNKTLLFVIFSKLSLYELVSCSSSHKAWRQYLKEPVFWQQYRKANSIVMPVTDIKSALLTQIQSTAAHLPDIDEQPSLCRDIFSLYRYFKLSNQELTKGLQRISTQFDSMQKRFILMPNAHLSLLPFMRQYLCHSSVKSFEQASQLMVDTMEDNFGTLMISLFATHPQCLPVFLQVSVHLDIGVQEYFQLLRNYFYHPEHYLQDDPELCFDNTMNWAQAIPTSESKKEQAYSLIKQ